MDDPKKYIGEILVSERYGVSRSWLQQMRWKHSGPIFSKIGSRCLYSIADLETYFKDRKVNPSKQKDD